MASVGFLLVAVLKAYELSAADTTTAVAILQHADLRVMLAGTLATSLPFVMVGVMAWASNVARQRNRAKPSPWQVIVMVLAIGMVASSIGGNLVQVVLACVTGIIWALMGRTQVADRSDLNWRGQLAQRMRTASGIVCLFTIFFYATYIPWIPTSALTPKHGKSFAAYVLDVREDTTTVVRRDTSSVEQINNSDIKHLGLCTDPSMLSTWQTWTVTHAEESGKRASSAYRYPPCPQR